MSEFCPDIGGLTFSFFLSLFLSFFLSPPVYTLVVVHSVQGISPTIQYHGTPAAHRFGPTSFNAFAPDVLSYTDIQRSPEAGEI